MIFIVTITDGATLYRGPSGQAAWAMYAALDRISRRYPRHRPSFAYERAA